MHKNHLSVTNTDCVCTVFFPFNKSKQKCSKEGSPQFILSSEVLHVVLNDSIACNPHTLPEGLFACYISKPNTDSHNSLYE